MLISPLPHPLSQAWPEAPSDTQQPLALCHHLVLEPPVATDSPSAAVCYKAKHPLLVHPPLLFPPSQDMEHTFPEFLGLNLILEAINFNRAADCSRTGIRSCVNKITFLHLPSSALPMLSSLWPLLGGKEHNKIDKKTPTF